MRKMMADWGLGGSKYGKTRGAECPQAARKGVRVTIGNDGWRFVADTVMGGVSSGRLEMVQEGGATHARLTGQVRTANNGGFIQMRRDLAAPPPADSSGVRLVVRGNGQRYFVHLRLGASRVPWAYFQAPFVAAPDWHEVVMPFSAFAPSRGAGGQTLRPEGIVSVAIAAFGRDHDAMVEAREVSFV